VVEIRGRLNSRSVVQIVACLNGGSPPIRQVAPGPGPIVPKFPFLQRQARSGRGLSTSHLPPPPPPPPPFGGFSADYSSSRFRQVSGLSECEKGPAWCTNGSARGKIQTFTVVFVVMGIYWSRSPAHWFPARRSDLFFSSCPLAVDLSE